MAASTNKHLFIDPVCHMKVPKDSKVPSYLFRSNINYFCANTCRDAFIANPDKYLHKNSPRHKGLWGRYLDQLNKVTGGKPPRCH